MLNSRSQTQSRLAPLCRGQSDYLSEGFTVADENGYDNNGTTNTVTLNIPPVFGASAGRSGAIEALVQSEIPSTFANIVNIKSFTLSGRAVSTCETGSAYAIFAGGTTCDKQIEWSGSDTSVTGDVHSNGTITISGSGNEVVGNITWGDADIPSDLNQGNNTIPNATLIGFQEYPVNFESTDYSIDSPPENITFVADDYADTDGDGYLNLDNGVYYTPGNIILNLGYVEGNVTFVAGGFIDISGSNHNLTPYVDNLLAFSYYDPGLEDPDKRCTEPVVKFAGSDHYWEGIVFAPDAMIDMSGSDNSTFAGSLIGYTIRMPGSELGIEVIEDTGNPIISLIE